MCRIITAALTTTGVVFSVSLVFSNAVKLT